MKMNLLNKPVLIIQSERALTEIALLRDECSGEPLERMERAWQDVNQVRQQLIDSLTVQEELALVKQRQEMHKRKRPEFIRLEVKDMQLPIDTVKN